MENNYESIKTKVLKLQVLVERGERGEAEKAKRLIDKLLSKHGLSLEWILNEGEEKKWYQFRYERKWQANLLHQCYYKIANVNEVEYFQRKGYISYELTAYQYAEISNLFEWHKRQLGKELKQMEEDMFSAYANKHQIFSDVEEPQEAVTAEDIRKALKLRRMMDELEDVSYIRQLEFK